MAIVTLWCGVGLIVLGIVSYAGSGAESLTALIPAFFGIALAGLGFVGQRQDRRALTMHIAALLALLGFLGSAVGLVRLPDLVVGEDLERPWAVGAQSMMALALAVYLALAVRNFVAARKARTS